MRRRVLQSRLALLVAALLCVRAGVVEASLGPQAAPLPQDSQEAAEKTPGQLVIEAVPEEARSSFIFYQLAQALDANSSHADYQSSPRFAGSQERPSSRQLQEFEAIPTYASFPADLLRWMLESFDVDEAGVQRLLQHKQTMLCTPSGVCFSGDDIGCYCCPF